MEVVDNSTGLACLALVILDGLIQVGRTSVVEKEDSLPNAPERGGSEFIGSGAALCYTVGQAFSHVVNEDQRCAVWFDKAALGTVEDPLAIILPVVNEAVWQCAQPTFVNV